MRTPQSFFNQKWQSAILPLCTNYSPGALLSAGTDFECNLGLISASASASGSADPYIISEG